MKLLMITVYKRACVVSLQHGQVLHGQPVRLHDAVVRRGVD